MSLRSKLLGSFAFVVLLMVAQGINSLGKLAVINGKIESVVGELQPALLTARKLSEELKQASAALGFYLLSKEDMHKDAYQAGLQKIAGTVASLERLPVMRARQDSMQLLHEIGAELERFASYRERLVELVEVEGRNIPAMEYASRNVNPLAREISQLLTQMILDEEDQAATVERKRILADLNNLRYAWSNLMNEMRLFLAFRAPAARENMALYQGSVQGQLIKVQAWGEALSFEQADALAQVEARFADFDKHLDALIGLHESDKWRMDAWMIRNQINPILDAISGRVDALVEQLEAAGRQSNREVQAIYHSERNVVLLSSFAALGVSCLLGWALIRNVLRQLGADPSRLEAIAEGIASGNLDNDREHAGKTVTGVYSSIRLMQDNLRGMLASEREAAAVNARIRAALDNVSGNVIIVNPEHRVIYMNAAAAALLRGAEAAIRREFPEFRAANLVGNRSDLLNADGASYRRLIDGLTTSHTEDIAVGGMSLRLTYNPVRDEHGGRMGTAIEIVDRTQSVATEEEVQAVVAAAMAGDLGRRISLAGKDGFFASLSATVNSLVTVSECVIQDTVRAIGAMSRGDLSVRIESDCRGTFGELRDNTNTSIDRITDILGRIKDSAQLVSRASREIAHGNNNLSHRTEEQAATLQQTTASMDVITRTVNRNTASAQQASLVSSEVRTQAEASGAVSARAIGAMSDISASSQEMAAIVGVIDDIAFQTNLLALNAAVEAARAGDQGRGFAVVASEVRNLAGRSASAAREIKELIEDSVRRVDEGARLVGEAGAALDRIIGAVKQVGDIIDDIAAGSGEQAESIASIGRMVVQMGEMTQQNAALVEQAAAASEVMDEQAQNLNLLVDYFTTAGQAAPSSREGSGSQTPEDHGVAGAAAASGWRQAAG
ncbi:MAG: methyl-accepting chemotaxis protein [Pseudomonadota bacterium]